MTTYLVIQNTYSHVEIALYNDILQRGYLSLDKTVASKKIIPSIDQILRNAQCIISDLSFIGVNEGPGPFTTLRVVIASINGIAFATHIPLIGINGLQALLAQYSDDQCVALLNAFGNEAYYATQSRSLKMEAGCQPIEQIIEQMAVKFPTGKITFIGNGATLFEEKIKKALGIRAYIQPELQAPSLNQIATMALGQWTMHKKGATQISPLYLKSAFIKR
jgi:tRNA threonylcarbamoyladenosine biosynthesis protein TsaB